MGLDEPLLDFASAAHDLRHRGYSEAQIARAAGLADLIPTSAVSRGVTADEVVEILAQRDSLHRPEQRETLRRTVVDVLTITKTCRSAEPRN